MQVDGVSFSWKNRLSNLSWHHCFTLFFSRSDSVFGQRRMSWLLPSSYYSSKLKEPTQPERDRLVAIILHLIFCTSDCVSLPKHKSVSVPCDFSESFFCYCAHACYPLFSCNLLHSCDVNQSGVQSFALQTPQGRCSSFLCWFVCLAVTPLGAVTFKICPCSPQASIRTTGGS